MKSQEIIFIQSILESANNELKIFIENDNSLNKDYELKKAHIAIQKAWEILNELNR